MSAHNYYISFVLIVLGYNIVRAILHSRKMKRAALQSENTAETTEKIDSSGCPFLAVVALPKTFVATAENVIEKIQHLYPNLPFRVGDPLDLPAELASLGNPDRPADLFFAIRLGDTSVFVTATSKGVLSSDFEDAIANSTEWPEARDAFSKVAAEVAVSRVGPGEETIEEKRLAALKTMIVSSAIADLGRGFAIKWFESELLIKPEAIKQLIADCFEEKWPTSTWVNFKNITRADPAQSPSSELVTGGLASFVGREMQFLPVPIAQDQLMQKAFSLADYMIKFGPVFGDGFVITSDTDEKIHMRYADKGYWADTKFLQVEIENPKPVTVH